MLHHYVYVLIYIYIYIRIGIIARVAFGSSVLASFPLIFLSMRNYFVNLASTKLPAIAGIKRISTLLLLFISYLASKFIDIGVVGSLAGGILGKYLCICLSFISIFIYIFIYVYLDFSGRIPCGGYLRYVHGNIYVYVYYLYVYFYICILVIVF
jgi:hypothetical protein